MSAFHSFLLPLKRATRERGLRAVRPLAGQEQALQTVMRLAPQVAQALVVQALRRVQPR